MIDDSSVDYSYLLGGQAKPADGEGRIMEDTGGGSTNGGSHSFDTNGLWLAITGVTNGMISLELNNAMDEVYEVWSTTLLTNS